MKRLLVIHQIPDVMDDITDSGRDVQAIPRYLAQALYESSSAFFIDN